jgi:hypothetical protein
MSYSRSYLGKGTIYTRKRGIVGAPLVPMGNCSKLALEVSQESLDELDYENPGGGKRQVIYQIKGVTGKLTTRNHSPLILAMGLRGTVSTPGTAAVAGEAHADIALGSLVVFDQFPDWTKPVTVKKGGAVIAPANYEQRRIGMYIPAGAPGLVAGDGITVDYTPLASDVVQPLTGGADEYVLVFDGLNEADSGKAAAVECWRAVFSPLKSLDLINDKLGEIELEFELLADDSISAPDESRYFRARSVK